MKTVLLVEDSADDVFRMKRACQRSGIPHSLQVVTNGDEAIDYLLGSGGYSGRGFKGFPDLVFVDLKLSAEVGRDVVKRIRSNPGSRSVPVVILSGLPTPNGPSRAYELGVTSYLRKLPCQAEFGQAVRVILKYWLEVAAQRA